MIEMTVEEFFKRIDKQQDDADEARALFARTMDDLSFNEEKPTAVKPKKEHKEIAKELVESFENYYFTGSDVLEIAGGSSNNAKRFDDVYKEELIENLKELGYEMILVKNPELRSRKAYRLKRLDQ